MPPPHSRTERRRAEKGVALLLVVLFTMALSSLALLIMLGVTRESRATDNYMGIQEASDAADGGLEYGVAMIWGRYQNSLRERAASLPEYRKFLDRIVVNRKKVELLPKPRELKSGASVNGIVISRQDSGDRVELTLRATASARGRERVAVQILDISAAEFEGLDYALLGNNLDCVVCHLEVDNVNRVYNTDPERYNSYERVKMGSLENLKVRLNEARSNIAGALFTRGQLLGQSGRGTYKPLDNLRQGSFKAYESDDNDNILENKKGATRRVTLDKAEVLDDGLLDPHANLYPNYPATSEEMTAGALPSSLPPVVPDRNGNRQVDDEEWKEKVGSSARGSLSGGTAYGLRAADSYKEDALPAASNAAAKVLAQSGYLDGNLILVGTEKDPIKLDGTLSVNGDVVVKGKIAGTGEILARGNIYFVGDVTYADGEKFGVSKDGTENAVAFSAGGNIVAGDFLTPQAYNKLEYKENKTVFFDDGRGKKFPAYLSEETIDSSPPLDEGYYTSFTSAQMMLFNQREYAKARANEKYVPRYYNMREGDDTYLYTSRDVEHANEYDSSLMRIMRDEELKGAAVLSMTPQGMWLSDMQLKQFWAADQRARPKKNASERLRIDGLLYSNNAILAMAQSYRKHRSALNGSLQIRGAVIGTDIGLLAPGDKNAKKNDQGLRIYYDKRVKDLLSLEGSDDLALRRGFRLFEYPGQPL